MAAAVAACSQNASDKTQEPGRVGFQEGQMMEDLGLFSEAIEKFKKVSTENQGTRLGSFAYFRLAELYSRQEDWIQAETNYRLFLSANSNSHLNAYVLYRLLKVNDKKSYTGLLFPEREVDRDMEPNKQIITEYKRFYLLYPQSMYVGEVVPIYRAARQTLAEHEMRVADFYVRHKQYNAAANRYLYVLRNFPELSDQEYALRELIDSYRKDQQPGLADEMQRIYEERYGTSAKPATFAPAGPQAANTPAASPPVTSPPVASPPVASPQSAEPKTAPLQAAGVPADRSQPAEPPPAGAPAAGMPAARLQPAEPVPAGPQAASPQPAEPQPANPQSAGQ